MSITFSSFHLYPVAPILLETFSANLFPIFYPFNFVTYNTDFHLTYVKSNDSYKVRRPVLSVAKVFYCWLNDSRLFVSLSNFDDIVAKENTLLCPLEQSIIVSSWQQTWSAAWRTCRLHVCHVAVHDVVQNDFHVLPSSGTKVIQPVWVQKLMILSSQFW